MSAWGVIACCRRWTAQAFLHTMPPLDNTALAIVHFFSCSKLDTAAHIAGDACTLHESHCGLTRVCGGGLRCPHKALEAFIHLCLWVQRSLGADGQRSRAFLEDRQTRLPGCQID